MSEFSILVPRLPTHTRLPMDETGVNDLALFFGIVNRVDIQAVLSRFERLTTHGLMCGTSAYQALLLDDAAYAEWFDYDHVTFDFYGETGYARFVYERSRRDRVPLSLFEERLRTLVYSNGSISRRTLIRAVTKPNYTPKRHPETKALMGFSVSGRKRSTLESQNRTSARAKPRKPFVYNGERFPDLAQREFKSKTDFIRATGTLLPISLVRSRLALGWSLDDAVSAETNKRPLERSVPLKKSGARKVTAVVNPKIPVVYVATLKSTGMKFVGATRNRALFESFAKYLRTVGKREGASSTISEFDLNDFHIEIVEVVDVGDPEVARRRWIKHLGTLHPNGYNLKRKGRIARKVGG